MHALQKQSYRKTLIVRNTDYKNFNISHLNMTSVYKQL